MKRPSAALIWPHWRVSFVLVQVWAIGIMQATRRQERVRDDAEEGSAFALGNSATVLAAPGPAMVLSEGGEGCCDMSQTPRRKKWILNANAYRLTDFSPLAKQCQTEIFGE